MTNTEVLHPANPSYSSLGTTPSNCKPQGPPEPSGSGASTCSVMDFHRTDAGNAALFADLFRDKVRYDHRHGRWLLWEKHWFREDLNGQIQRYAREVPKWRASAARNLGDDESRQREAR